MSQPPGVVDLDHLDYVCHLKKAIYGINQALRAWYLELKAHLLNNGFINSLVDASLFVYKQHSCLLYVLIYVDDIIVPVINKLESKNLSHHLLIASQSKTHLIYTISWNRSNTHQRWITSHATKVYPRFSPQTQHAWCQNNYHTTFGISKTYTSWWYADRQHNRVSNGGWKSPIPCLHMSRHCLCG